MDASLYRDFVTSRGYNYHYYRTPASGSKPTILLVHGFPSTSYDWHPVAVHFKSLGYGLVIPDMLGYAGTSKPTEPEVYRMSLMTKDLIEVLDAEGLGKVIVVGHDWGAVVTSRLANYYPERFHAFAFLSVGYFPPTPGRDLQEHNEATKKELGYEQFGYWYFFADDDAPEVISKNWESFVSVLWPLDPRCWKTDFAPLGALRSYLTSGRITDLPSYITPEYKAYATKTLLEDGFTAPLNWYKVQTLGFASDDDKQIPQERYIVTQPVFFGATLKDYISLPELIKKGLRAFCKNTTVKDYDADHWVVHSDAELVNKDLQEWIEGVVAAAIKL